jgi:superfamily II DNA or RNA helicase
MTRQLRDDQLEAVETLRTTISQGVRRIMLQAPTAYGKTIWAAHVVENCLRKRKRCTFIVDAISLIDQTVQRFYEEGITDVGVLQGDHPMQDFSKPVQIASIQTLAKRNLFPECDLVIIDEAHLAHIHHKAWLERGGPIFIGLSATPYTRGLGRYFDTMITAMTTEEAIRKGILCPPRVFSASHPDLKARLKKVKTVADEYVVNQLSEAMSDKELTGDVVETWQSLWGKDKTLCFAVDRAHAKLLQERFTEAGVSCAYQDADTDRMEREAIKRQFHAGDVRVVCSIGTMTKGIDWQVDCISLARPTKSRTLFKQIVGRGLRTAPGKDFCLVLDHGRCTQELGFVTEIEADALDDGKPGPRRKPPMRYAKECPKCHQFRTPGKRACDNCGFEPTPQCSWVETDDALEEIDRRTLPKGRKNKATMEEKAHFFAQLKSYCRTHGYKPGWAAVKYREKFGEWPDHPCIKHAVSQAPGPATVQWIKASNIRWAKSQRNPANAAKPKPVDPSDYAHVQITRCAEGATSISAKAMDAMVAGREDR